MIGSMGFIRQNWQENPAAWQSSCGTEISRELEDLELLLKTSPWLELDRFAGFDLQRSLGQRINAGAGITTRYRESAKPNKLDSNSVFGRLVANFNGFTRFLNGGLDGGQYGPTPSLLRPLMRHPDCFESLR